MEQTIGKRIAAHRKSLGLTQEQLAEKLGITAQAVSKWENNQSCPDIAMVPRLAELFGTTTDELLGVESKPKEEPKTAMGEILENQDKEDNNWTVDLDIDRKNGIGIAVWVILSGGLLLVSNLMNLRANLWDVLWPTALLTFGLFGLWPKFSFLRLGCALAGAYFTLSNLNMPLVLPNKGILIPLVLLFLGLSLLADALGKGKKHGIHISHNGKDVKKNTYEVKDGKFVCGVNFGDAERKISIPILAGGSAQVNFGELTLDLSGCEEIQDGCTIEVSCDFGELEFRVPENCVVEPSVRTSFGSLDIDGEPAPNASRTIYLKGSVSFGEMTVSYK